MLSLLTNVDALNARYNLSNAQAALSTSLARLSSGLRINSAADDPAGSVLSLEQQGQIAGLNAALTNTNRDNNVVQIAGGALNQINSLLLQIQGLAVDAANAGAGSPNQVQADQAQITNAINTITRIATSTTYDAPGTNTQLLDGSHAASASSSSTYYSGQVQGSVNTGSYTVAVTSAGTAATVTGGANINAAGSAETLTINNVQIAIGANSNLATQLAAINAVSSSTGVSAVANASKIILYSTSWGPGHAISVSSSAGTSSVTGLTAAGTTNVDGTNIAGTINGQTAYGNGNTLTAITGSAAGLTVTVSPDSTNTYTSASNNPFTTDTAGATLTVNANNALVFQVGANAGQTVSLSLLRAAADSIGTGVNSTYTNLGQINVTTTSGAAAALTVINKAISDVANMNGMVGAFQVNTLQATASNLQSMVQNVTAVNSLIRDTNFAAATAQYTQQQVLVQAGTTVLKNASLLPQLVLTLLQ